MQKKSIEIEKNDICEAVYMLTANAERERGDNAHVATEDNVALLCSFIDDAVSLLGRAVEYYGTTSVTEFLVKVELEMPGNWRNDVAAVKEAARVFLANYVVARWFELNGTADRFNLAMEQAGERIKRLLEYRKKPV